MASFSVVTNIAAVNAQANLYSTQIGFRTALARVSSGFRINSSGDDAAGLAVANSFRSQVAILTQGVRNANDGLSDLQIKDGALDNISKLLDRMATLATQSASSGFQGNRTTLDSEFQDVIDEIDRDLCGHATLASAHTLYETGSVGVGEEVRFHTRSGVLTAKRSGGWIELDFPSEEDQTSTAPVDLAKALGIRPKYVGRNRFDYIVEAESEDTLRRMNPDYSLLARVTTRGVIVTSRSDSEKYDFVSRFFAPAVGINEDPVTGSAHCCLGPFWKRKLHKDEFTAYQASERGGVVRVRVEGDRVFLSGQAVTVLKGQLLTD